MTVSFYMQIKQKGNLANRKINVMPHTGSSAIPEIIDRKVQYHYFESFCFLWKWDWKWILNSYY